MEIVSQAPVIIDGYLRRCEVFAPGAGGVFSGPSIFLVIGMLGDKERARPLPNWLLWPGRWW